MLMPMILLVVWAAFGCFPLLIYFNHRTVLVSVSIVQLGVSAFVFFQVKRIAGDSWFLKPEYFARPVFKLKNTVWFAAANIALLPVVFFLLLIFSVHLYLDNKTGGFMQVGSDGIYLQEKTYSRDGKTIRLVAMMHIGSKEYYEEMSRFLSGGKAIVLAEGVTDKTGILKNSLSYANFADFIGLDTQENMVISGKLIEYEDLTAIEEDSVEFENEPGIIRADIDSLDLSKDAIEFIENVSILFNNSDSIADGFGKYLSWYSENMTPEREEVILKEIVDKRNAVLLDYLDQALLRFDIIVIPWGAMHMPGLEQAILEKDFTVGERTSRLAVGFDRLFGANR